MWETPPASAGDKLMTEPPPNLGGGSFCRESVRQSAHSLPGCRVGTVIWTSPTGRVYRNQVLAKELLEMEGWTVMRSDS